MAVRENYGSFVGGWKIIRQCFYKDSQAPVIGFQVFALTRTCDIQRLLSLAIAISHF